MIAKNSIAIKRGNFLNNGKVQKYKTKDIYNQVSTSTCEIIIDGIKCLK